MIAEGRFGDLPLEESLFDGRDDSTDLIDPVEVAARLLLDSVREPLDEIAPPERVDGVGHPAFLREDLLRAQGDPSGVLGRELEGFVVGVGVERLGAAHHPGERLYRGTDHVQLRLLRRAGASRGLGVEPEPERPLPLRPEPVLHHVSPDPTRGAELRDLLKEIVVGVEKEGESRRELIDGKSRAVGRPRLSTSRRPG